MSCAEVWLHRHPCKHVVGCGRGGRICGGVRGRHQLGCGGITQIGSAADERHEESQKNQSVLHERKLLLSTGLGLAETGISANVNTVEYGCHAGKYLQSCSVKTLTTRANRLVGSQGMKVCVRNGFGKKAAIWLSRG